MGREQHPLFQPAPTARSPWICAPDRYRYILERRIVREPGRRWTYCGGATALLGRIIVKGTGMPLHAFAREALFDSARARPHGMAASMHKGEPYAASGLRMTPRDLARIGMMMAGGGTAGRNAGRASAMARALHRPDRQRR